MHFASTVKTLNKLTLKRSHKIDIKIYPILIRRPFRGRDGRSKLEFTGNFHKCYPQILLDKLKQNNPHLSHYHWAIELSLNYADFLQAAEAFL